VKNLFKIVQPGKQNELVILHYQDQRLRLA